MAPRDELQIAIVGMALRVPGADTLARFWDDQLAARDRITRFEPAAALAAGVPAALVSQPRYVRARGVLDGAEDFDPEFFGLGELDATLLDPQQRLFLLVAREALEHAGYDPRRLPGRLAVFAGCGLNSYALQHVARLADLRHDPRGQRALVANDKDQLALRVAHALDARGPAVTVQATCASALVAAHLGCQALIAHEADLALVGGASLVFPQHSGYLAEEDGLLSRDGVCRPFDREASGTVGGNGVAALLLQRRADQVAAGARCHAVLLGSALNNDGRDKPSYAAFSARAQVELIRSALALAEVDPRALGCVEAHGAGTPIGDQIELQALAEALGPRASPCLVTSGKGGHGHLDAAAGAVALIRAALALEHGLVPPVANLRDPLREPGLEVVATPRAWPGERLAGVSVFGYGGTNAHLILGTAPASLPTGHGVSRSPAPGEAAPQLLVVSARSRARLARAVADLAARLRQASSGQVTSDARPAPAHADPSPAGQLGGPPQTLAAVSLTLRFGREQQAWRAACIVADPAALPADLTGWQVAHVAPGASPRVPPTEPDLAAFMGLAGPAAAGAGGGSGQGAQLSLGQLQAVVDLWLGGRDFGPPPAQGRLPTGSAQVWRLALPGSSLELRPLDLGRLVGALAPEGAGATLAAGAPELAGLIRRLDEGARRPLLAALVRDALESRLGQALAAPAEATPLAAIGIDSFVAVTLLAQLNRALGTALPLASLAGRSTVGDLHDLLAEALRRPAPAVPAAPDEGFGYQAVRDESDLVSAYRFLQRMQGHELWALPAVIDPPSGRLLPLDELRRRWQEQEVLLLGVLRLEPDQSAPAAGHGTWVALFAPQRHARLHYLGPQGLAALTDVYEHHLLVDPQWRGRIYLPDLEAFLARQGLSAAARRRWTSHVVVRREVWQQQARVLAFCATTQARGQAAAGDEERLYRRLLGRDPSALAALEALADDAAGRARLEQLVSQTSYAGVPGAQLLAAPGLPPEQALALLGRIVNPAHRSSLVHAFGAVRLTTIEFIGYEARWLEPLFVHRASDAALPGSAGPAATRGER